MVRDFLRHGLEHHVWRCLGSTDRGAYLSQLCSNAWGYRSGPGRTSRLALSDIGTLVVWLCCMASDWPRCSERQHRPMHRDNELDEPGWSSRYKRIAMRERFGCSRMGRTCQREPGDGLLFLPG